MEQYDLLVIGGGINGLGIAADAAARGLTVCVVDKKDWGGGTTSASSRLIHGGLRYLQFGEFDLVRESLRERGTLARQRPHLVHPLSLLIPTYREAPLPRWMVGVGLGMYHMLARDPLFPAPATLSLAATLDREPALNPHGLTGGFTYPDAQLEFPERLCVELVQETVAAGGAAYSYTRVSELLCAGKGLDASGVSRVNGAVLIDEISGAERTIGAGMVVNAAGPWVDAVNRLLGGLHPPRLIGGTWGTHLILPARPAGPGGPVYATARRDGRPFFLLPWDGRLLVGTTDVKFDGGDPDTIRVEPWEVDYLLAETASLFPASLYAPTDVEAMTIGVRPLPVSDKNAGAITRRHFLVDHAEKHGIHGLASVVGGKLTTYRSLAEEVTDWVVKRAGKPPIACSTGYVSPDVLTADALLSETDRALKLLKLPGDIAPHLVYRYGPAAADVLARVKRDPSLGRPVCGDTVCLEAQVVHAAESEFARTIDDVIQRRLMIVPPTGNVVTGVRRIAQERGLPLAR